MEQKRVILEVFEECDNPFRVDDESFKYAHFRKDTVTFYQDNYGGSDIPKDVISFREFCKGFVKSED